jgi:hypothetical protein
MTILTFGTPRYILLHERERIGPSLSILQTAPTYAAIYGFSDKSLYDAFCKNSDIALTPYPLVKGYLQEQCENAGDTVKLVVIDAAGPNETQINATTMQSVLEAFDVKATCVSPSFRLRFDLVSQAYRVEKL